MAKAKTKILLLEDNPVHQGLLADELEDGGYSVRRANSVVQARTFLEHFQPDIFLFDLVVHDDHVAVINWVEDLRKPASKLKSIPIIFVTAYSREFSKQIRDIPLTTILEKPFEFDEIYKAIRSVTTAHS